jgi:hypothetical protein
MNPRTGTIEAHSTIFLGRRKGGLASIHALSDSGVERLRSERRFKESEIDWCGDLSAIELSHVLLHRVSGLPPSRSLAARFAVCLLMELDEGGFDLGVLAILEWLAVESDAEDWLVPARPSDGLTST